MLANSVQFHAVLKTLKPQYPAYISFIDLKIRSLNSISAIFASLFSLICPSRFTCLASLLRVIIYTYKLDIESSFNLLLPYADEIHLLKHLLSANAGALALFPRTTAPESIFEHPTWDCFGCSG